MDPFCYISMAMAPKFQLLSLCGVTKSCPRKEWRFIGSKGVGVGWNVLRGEGQDVGFV